MLLTILDYLDRKAYAVRVYIGHIPSHRNTFPTAIRRTIRSIFRLYLSEAEMTKCLLQWFHADPKTVKLMLDTTDPFMYTQRNIAFLRSIRNDFGLWESRNPHTKVGDTVELKDAVIIDPMFPDNLSARVAADVITSLKTLVAEQEKVERDQAWKDFGGARGA